jgi:SsrA-binding protein
MAKKKSQKSPPTPEGVKVVARNRKARFSYHIEETLEAGMVLLGTEVKSLREGKIQFKDAYARVKDHELFLVGLHIPPYSHAGELMNHAPERTRKLLVHRREIERLIGKLREKGLTMVPLQVYFKKGKAKVELGLGRGKRDYDKREDAKEREAKREMDRARRQR